MSVLDFNCRFHYPSGFRLDLAFTASAGVTALLGPSGCGKTTTLHLVSGLLTPDEGRITLGDRTLFDSSRRVNVTTDQRRIGLVFQDYQLFPHYTVAGNLNFGLRRARLKHVGAARIELAHLIEVLELGPLLARYPGSLSGGQRQRVSLGRAIASHPALLLLDEPVSALDEQLKSSVLEFLKHALAEFPIPTLLVTHDARSVAALSAQVVQLTQ